MSESIQRFVDTAGLRQSFQEIHDYLNNNVVLSKDLEGKVKDIVGGGGGGTGETVTPVVYGFKLNQGESDPDAMITYIEANKDFTPAHMDFTTDKFDYGSWADAFFIKNLRPVMLNYDGTEAYELDPNDYTKKKDGTPSDVANEAFEGNAMIAFPKTYWKLVDNGDNSCNVYISNTKADDNYHCWSHLNSAGEELDYCYMAIYDGCLVDGKLRSLSGKQPTVYTQASTFLTYAQANNPEGSSSNNACWNVGIYADHMLLTLLTTLIGRSTDTQATFGYGNTSSYSNSSTSTTTRGVAVSGVHNDKGLFYGRGNSYSNYPDGTGCVKLFGIENLWGNMEKFIAGLMFIYSEHSFKIKMTSGIKDGSSVYGYNITGDGYVTVEGPTSPNASCISAMYFNPLYGLLPNFHKWNLPAGSFTTYYCDRLDYSNYDCCAFVGGNTNAGYKAGIYCLVFDPASDNDDYTRGAQLSYRAN